MVKLTGLVSPGFEYGAAALVAESFDAWTLLKISAETNDASAIFGSHYIVVGTTTELVSNIPLTVKFASSDFLFIARLFLLEFIIFL